jgi:hypothetical protein
MGREANHHDRLSGSATPLSRKPKSSHVRRYILPHVDRGLAKQMMDKQWLPPESKKPLQSYMNP